MTLATMAAGAHSPTQTLQTNYFLHIPASATSGANVCAPSSWTVKALPGAWIIGHLGRIVSLSDWQERVPAESGDGYVPMPRYRLPGGPAGSIRHRGMHCVAAVVSD